MISVIIPALNERKALPTTLEHLLSLCETNRTAVEVIVVDGNSSDGTDMIAKSHSRVIVIKSARGRAQQMNAGAAIAKGDWLLFLHADTLLPENGLELIEALTENRDGEPKVDIGCFRQRFSGNRWSLKMISWLHNWRCRQTQIIYGDQAMFVRRSLFRSLNGFPQVEHMEDVYFSELAVQQTKPRILDATVTTDSRKFEQRGSVRCFIELIVILTCHEIKKPLRAKGFFSAVR